jgi:polyphosphate kinase
VSKSIYPYTQNRDISWLKFNERVLEMSLNQDIPILERLFFLKIVNSNLDEFFMIRMGSMSDVIHLKPDALDARTQIPIKRQTELIYEEARIQHAKKDESYFKLIQDVKNVLEILEYQDLNKHEQKEVDMYYETMLVPVLSPQIVDQNHPFPHIENKRIHLGLLLSEQGRTVFGILPVPSVLPIYVLNGSKKGIFVSNILSHHVKQVFKMFKMQAMTLFAVTRNADIPYNDDAYDDSYDMRSKMKSLLKKRQRLSAVRLEVQHKTDKTLKLFLEQKLNTESFQTFEVKSPMVFDFDGVISSVLKPIEKQALKFQKLTPQTRIHPNLSMMKLLTKQDLLMSYPYDVIDPFLKLIKEAALDKDVLSIKITIYRLAEKAELIDLLTLAAEKGKEVVVVIELKARFDEQNNIDFSEILERSGCKVIYGFEMLKVHSKLCVITKRAKNGFQYFTHVGTGNYNEITVRQYTDFSLLTSHQGIAEDAIKVFQAIGMGHIEHQFEHLWVAPVSLKQNLLTHIELETHKKEEGYIFFKINALTDMDIIKALVRASQNGVKVDMVIRSISCIIPEVKDYTETIRIRSIVGRFLEHSRLYVFGKKMPLVFIGSADFMTRNTERRIEVAVPIYDVSIQNHLLNYIELWLNDGIQAKKINSLGNHEAIESKSKIQSQLHYFEHPLPLIKKPTFWNRLKK